MEKVDTAKPKKAKYIYYKPKPTKFHRLVMDMFAPYHVVTETVERTKFPRAKNEKGNQ